MNIHPPLLALLVAACLPLFADNEEAKAKAKAEPITPEAAFSAMLENATLRGTWAPIDQRLLGNDQQDGYQIARATKKEGDKWEIVYRMKIQGQQIDYPLPVTVKFAGDTAVMILENSPVGIGQTWSARILFHNDVYAGSWWNESKTKSGIVSGTITREKSE